MLRLPENPPTISTSPFGSSVAVWVPRGSASESVAVNTPVAGSYRSALFVPLVLEVKPPARSTLPLPSRVAVWETRRADIVPVGVISPVAGS